MPKIKATEALQVENINEVVSTDDEESETNVMNLLETHMPSSPVDDQPLCANCSKCICRNWSAFVTPEIVAFLSTLTESLKQQADLGQASTTTEKTMIELCPQTGIFITQPDVNLALTQSNGKPKALLMNLVLSLVSKEELLAHQTAEKFTKSRGPNFQKAMLHFIAERTSKSVTTREYNKVINDYIYYHKKKHTYRTRTKPSELTNNYDSSSSTTTTRTQQPLTDQQLQIQLPAN